MWKEKKLIAGARPVKAGKDEAMKDEMILGAELTQEGICPVCFREYGDDGIRVCTSEDCPSVNPEAA